MYLVPFSGDRPYFSITSTYERTAHELTAAPSFGRQQETDQAVEKLVIGRIKEAYPGHSFIGEESTAGGASQTLTAEPTWVSSGVPLNDLH